MWFDVLKDPGVILFISLTAFLIVGFCFFFKKSSYDPHPEKRFYRRSLYPACYPTEPTLKSRSAMGPEDIQIDCGHPAFEKPPVQTPAPTDVQEGSPGPDLRIEWGYFQETETLYQSTDSRFLIQEALVDTMDVPLGATSLGVIASEAKQSYNAITEGLSRGEIASLPPQARNDTLAGCEVVLASKPCEPPKAVIPAGPAPERLNPQARNDTLAGCEVALASKSPSATTKDVCIKIAQTKEELEAAYQLVYDVYAKDRYIKPNAWGLHVTLFHLLPQTKTFVATLGGEMVGTATVVPDSLFGLPLESLFGEEVKPLQSLGILASRFTLQLLGYLLERKNDRLFHELVQGYRAQGRRMAEVTSLVVHKDQRNPRLLPDLLKFAYQ